MSVTVTVQVTPGLIVAVQLLLWLKSPETLKLTPVTLLLPKLLMVNDSELLVPTTVVGKLRVDAEKRKLVVGITT